MKIDQDELTSKILNKIKEVNDEAGYRTYLEVPEMTRIICEVVEQELYAKLDAWEECATNLVEYAREFTSHLSAWGKGYGRYEREIKEAEERIATYNKLKNERESNA
jgi:hypothetical protein